MKRTRELNEDNRMSAVVGNINTYLSSMLDNGSWGDDIILSAAARFYGKPIHIYTTDNDKTIEINLPNYSTPQEMPILLDYIAMD